VLDKANKELNELDSQRVHVPETLEQDLIQLPGSIRSLQTQVEQCRAQVQKRYADADRMEMIPRDLTKTRDMMVSTLELLEKSRNDKRVVDSVKIQIERENQTLSSLKLNLEQLDRHTKSLEERSVAQAEMQRQRRLQQEQAIATLETNQQVWESKVQESRRLLEEKRKRQAEILQREEQWAKEATEAMELLKHQFECYTSEVLPALRMY
jgi:DNA repair exonuclease SbcCD ATPase subunit